MGYFKTMNYFDVSFSHLLMMYLNVSMSFYLILLRMSQTAFAKDITTNDHMCPDPILNGNREERINLINHNLRVISMPVSDILKPRGGGLQEDIPCSFIDTSNVDKRGFLKVEVRAVKFSFQQYNYTGSTGDCRFFVKFRMNEKAVTNATQICRMYKIFGSENGLVENPPSIWLNPNNKLGFIVPAPSDNISNNTTNHRPLYLQVVYKIHYSMGACVINVQQYSINSQSKSKECDGSLMKHQLCGSYSCWDQHKLLKDLGFLHYDIVVDNDNKLDRFLNDMNSLKKLDYEFLKNYDIDKRDGDYYFKPKRNYHAALFSGMTRAISFLFVLSILISCISYQLRPYLRPSSPFENEFHDRTHDTHRRCYRRPNSNPVLPSNRPTSNDVGPLDPTMSTTTVNMDSIRGQRPRRYFHQRPAPNPNLPSFQNQVTMEQPPASQGHLNLQMGYNEGPPAYDEMLDVPPTYAETINRDRSQNDPQIIPTDNNDVTSPHNPTNK